MVDRLFVFLCFFILLVLQQIRWHVSNSIWGGVWRCDDVVMYTTRFGFLDAHGKNTPQGWQACIKKRRKSKNSARSHCKYSK